jgi:hypothetical protein
VVPEFPPPPICPPLYLVCSQHEILVLSEFGDCDTASAPGGEEESVLTPSFCFLFLLEFLGDDPSQFLLVDLPHLCHGEGVDQLQPFGQLKG